jgi:LPXTG-motif cell wall-anchored protein
VSPAAAAAFLAGIVYMWGEALFRLAFTYNANFDAFWVLWNGRVGDIAAMWLTISGVAAVIVFPLGYLFFRRRTHLGSIQVWTIVLILSAIIAPLIGEIGTPIGI